MGNMKGAVETGVFYSLKTLIFLQCDIYVSFLLLLPLPLILVVVVAVEVIIQYSQSFLI